jgi:hypothetical protein
MIALTNALAPFIGQPGLEISVSPGVLWLNGFIINLPLGTVFLPPNSTSYVFLNTSSGLLGTNTTGYNTVDIPIAAVVTSFTTVVSLTETRPDFTNLAGSGSSVLFSDAEVPEGSGSSFTLLNAPDPADSLFLTKNGQALTQRGASPDYTLSSNNITLTVSLVSGDVLQAWYRY